MSETKIIGITAVVSSGLAVLLLAGMLVPMLGTSWIRTIEDSDYFTVYPGSYHTIDATFEKDERWVVEFTASYYDIHAYLLSDSNYDDFMYYGYVSSYISSKYGTSGYFDYMIPSNGNYHVVFQASSHDTSVSVTMTEYHLS